MPYVKRATDYMIPVANTLLQTLSALLEAQVWLLLNEFRHERKEKMYPQSSPLIHQCVPVLIIFDVIFGGTEPPASSSPEVKECGVQPDEWP